MHTWHIYRHMHSPNYTHVVPAFEPLGPLRKHPKEDLNVEAPMRGEEMAPGSNLHGNCPSGDKVTSRGRAEGLE